MPEADLKREASSKAPLLALPRSSCLPVPQPYPALAVMDSPPRTPSPQPIPPQAQLPMRTVVRRRAGARVAGKTLPHTPHPQLLAAMNAGSPCEGRATRLARELDFQVRHQPRTEMYAY